MHWWYKFIEKRGDDYVYAYSCESDVLDGVIVYSTARQKAAVEKESYTDKGIERRVNRSVQHFYILVRENFPEIRHVCCG